VFWGPSRPSSLTEAIKWKESIQKSLPTAKESHFPFVLLTDNTLSVEWMGEGKVFKDKQEMDSFCEKHGFCTWFEMRESDWELGEENVFGRAVDRIVKDKQSTGHSQYNEPRPSSVWTRAFPRLLHTQNFARQSIVSKTKSSYFTDHQH